MGASVLQIRAKRKDVALTWSRLRLLALSYALLPVLLFIIGWLRRGVSLGALAALAFVWLWSSFPSLRRRLPLWSTRFDSEGSNDTDRAAGLGLQRISLLLLAVVAIAWVFFSGIGGFWAQSSDFTARNSIFHSLVLEAWPVYFDGGMSALVYYLNHWLPPAAIGKVMLFLSGDPDLAMTIANVALCLWSALGVFLVGLLVLFYLRASTFRSCVIGVLFLVFFSGMDIVGVIFRCLMGSSDVANHVFGMMHLEQWAGSSFVQYSSNTTLLYWVFNQTIIPWICTLAVLIEPGPSRYVPFILACFGAGPYPTVGLAIICVAMGIQELVRAVQAGRAVQLVRSALSPANLCATILALVYVFFFMGNHSVSTSGERMQMFGLAPGATLRLIILFYLVEVGVYAILLYRRFNKVPLYWLSVVILAVLPFVHFGSWYEVCFRVSIPFLMVICLLCARMVIDDAPDLLRLPVGKMAPTWLLVIALAIGALTPIFEFARGAVSVCRNGIEGSLQPAADIAGSTVEDGAQSNFKAPISDGSIFFTYLAEPYEGN